MIFFCGHLDHVAVLIDFEQVLETDDLGDFALGRDGEADWLQTFKLDFEHACESVVLFYGRDFDGDFD